jgi:hypothetical protein
MKVTPIYYPVAQEVDNSLMNRFLPKRLRPDLAALLPANPSIRSGPALAWWVALVYLFMITVRSFIHLLATDGGAHSIATIDISVAGGANVVALFGQWGAIQLLLALLLWVLLLRYRGFVPLVLLVFFLEPALRSYANYLKPLTFAGAAPGAALNWFLEPFLGAALFLSLCPTQQEPTTEHL